MELHLIQDYDQLSSVLLMRYHRLHNNERDWIEHHPEQYKNHTSALKRTDSHIKAIEFVCKTRGIDPEEQSK